MADELVQDCVRDAEMVLIGIGEEFQSSGTDYDKRILCALQKLPSLVKGKTYFAVSQNTDDLLFRSGLFPFFITQPYGADKRKECGEEQWNTYLRWLSGTLGHKLCILELGVGFSNPQLIRWPFERTALMNLHSTFVRVHEIFPQLPKELAQTKRACSIRENAVEWLLRDAK